MDQGISEAQREFDREQVELEILNHHRKCPKPNCDDFSPAEYRILRLKYGHSEETLLRDFSLCHWEKSSREEKEDQ